MLKIAIIWANPYNKNFGVAALGYSSLALINDCLKENNLKGEFTFIGSSEIGKDSISIGNNIIEFNNIMGLDYFSKKSWLKMILQPKKYGTFKLSKFDYIFDIGEGDSFSDIYGIKRFNRVYSSKVFLNFLKKKQIILPQTIGPFKDIEIKRKADAIMSQMAYVFSRDEKSYQYTKSILSGDKIGEFIDVAFYMPFNQKSYNDDKVHVGINVSGLLWTGGYTGNNQFNLKLEYKDTLIKIIEYFLTKNDVLVHIISHVTPDKPIEDDYEAAMEIKKRFPNIIVAPKFQSPIEAKSYISGMDYFTGARMHSCIAAFSTGVPVIPMAYSRKFNGLFVDTLQYDELADCVNVDEKGVISKVKEGYENRKILKEKIHFSNTKIVIPRLEILKNKISNILSNEKN